MPHALLLSPDDQAVSAITAVLDEMSVTCERPMDGPTAAKKLTSQSFDLVLVDCENLPAAKLIFDVCRRSQTGTNPVPIAIVDGRAGLPTAFRLGAELILTKPVARDQARTTIRTAVSRVRKDETSRVAHPFEEPAAPKTSADAAETHEFAAEPQAIAAAAAAGAAPAQSAPASEAPTAQMGAATDEIHSRPALKEPPVFFTEKPVTSVPNTEMFMPPAAAPAPKPSDDPVLADLESDLPTPQVFSSYSTQKKGTGSLWALLVIMVLGGGFYGAWMYQPGFREFAKPQIDKAMAMFAELTNSAPPERSTPAPVAAKPPAPAPAPAATAPEGESPATAGTTASESTSTATPASNSSSTPASAEPAPAPAAADKSVSEPAKTQAPPEVSKVAATPAAEAELPGEKSAVILSSQGAEKRLLHHATPVYPAEARKAGVEGTVVLKAVISETGAVHGVRVVEGNPALTAAAVAAVKQWRYRPYLRDGKTLPFQTIVLVEFQRP